MKSKRAITIIVIVAAAVIAGYLMTRRPSALVLTGIVTTNEVVVSPQVGGQIVKLLVTEGDHVVRDQLLAEISSGELAADRAFYTRTEAGSADQVRESESSLRFEEQQTAEQIRQSSAALGAVIAQREEAVANLANMKLVLDRDEQMLKSGAMAQQEIDQARAAYAVAKSRADAIDKQIEASRAALALAQSTAHQVAAKKSAFSMAQQQHAAASAQTAKANVRLGYAELHAPVSGIVDVRAARAGEVVNAGQPVLTIIDPDDLWIRTDVEESYIDRVRIGDSLGVRLPSGEKRMGVVFFRGVDAGFATQRDVSRIKRDIKTFEVRLRVDNRERRLAVGMTAYVTLPIGG
ncbi:MAG: efflux RND transporter periplasmic adaptor subunit [bacterium]